MAFTGTLRPKVSRKADTLPLPRPAKETYSSTKDPADAAVVPFYLVLTFSFFLLARPQDYIKPLRTVQFAMVLGAASIFTWALGVFSGQIKFRKSKELNLMVGLTIWFILGVPFGFYRSNSLTFLVVDWVKVLMIFLVLTQTVTTTKRLRLLLWVIFLSGFIATGLSLAMGGERIAAMQEGTQTRFLGMSRGFFFGNYLGVAASVILPYMAAVLIYTRSALKQLLLFACFASMMGMLVLTSSRGNLISIILALILTWFVVLKDSIKAKMIGVVFVGCLVVAIAFAPMAVWERVGVMWSSSAESADSKSKAEAEMSSMQRQELLMRSLLVTVQRPIFGLGIDNFEGYSGSVTGDSQQFQGTHNTFTQISAETGIPALIMFLVLLSTGISRMRRVSRGFEGRPEFAQEKRLADATMVSIISFIVGGCFAHLGFDYYIYYLLAIGVALQTIYTLSTGESVEFASAGLRNKKKMGWRRTSALPDARPPA